MKKKMILVAVAVLTLTALTGCGKKDDTDYEHLRELSWEGTELTISLGVNKDTGCEWDTDPQDDSVIDYSINRVFHLANSGALKGETIGILDAGFEGQGEGTVQILCTTPVDWDGSGEGYAYLVTVTVDADGTILDAEGEEVDKDELETGTENEEETLPDADIEAATELAGYAGKYDAVGVAADGEVATSDAAQGWYVELWEDGTGYLFLGDDNQGDVSGWSMDGEALTLYAGVSEFAGESAIHDDLLLLDFDDFVLAFEKE